MNSDLVFYLLAGLILVSVFSMVVTSNPVFSALSLALTMISLSGVFYLLGAHFIAGVQLIVYAGAVMVLFVMVLMLFDLKKETTSFSKGYFGNLLKLIFSGLLLGIILGAADKSTDLLANSYEESALGFSQAFDMKSIATLLFTKYLFSFELLGVLLLLIAVGVVSIARRKGGTHASE